MLPLVGQFADGVSHGVRALRAVKFASDDVAVHGRVFPGWGLSLARDAATISEPLYIVKEMHARLAFCSIPAQLWGKPV